MIKPLTMQLATTSSKNWAINIDGYICKNVIKQMLDDDMPQDSINAIVQNGVRILSQCPNPNIVSEERSTGIVIGKVQSGKTSNFISVLALAFDNGYNLAIVLGGNKKNLTKQNSIRIQQAFNLPPEKLVVLTTEANSSLITPEQIRTFILEKRKVIIVGLKHPSHINSIANIFDNTALTAEPTIIIDDEGDQATLNNKAYQNSMSSTYESVIRLKSCIQKNCFLSVTATPQANILIDTCDKLSPSFGELVYPGDSYCGLMEFHGLNRDKYCKAIPEDENISILDPVGIPKSIYYALSDFFVGGAIRKYRGDNRPHSMLIHPSQRVIDHKLVKGKLTTLLDQWREKARMKKEGLDDVSYKTLRAELLAAYNRFKNDGVILPTFEDLEPICIAIIAGCPQILLCNSSENASENAKFWNTNIYVGGNMVERGITIKGLAVTYITRRARGVSNVDNTEQRARWFGYKSDYLDICRVWMPAQIKNDFSVILEHDDDLWATIIRAQNNGVKFQEIPRIFKLSSSVLQLTRKNVAQTDRLSLSEWKAQKYYLTDTNAIQNNTHILNTLKNDLSSNIVEKMYNGGNIHKLVKDVNYLWLYSNVLNSLRYKPDDILNQKLFYALNEILAKTPTLKPTIDLMWIRDYQHETRTIAYDGTIAQLFQGRNSNLSSPTFYPGDRSMVDERPNNMQLQIHYVQPTDNKSAPYCPILALYIPHLYSETISSYVVKRGGNK